MSVATPPKKKVKKKVSKKKATKRKDVAATRNPNVDPRQKHLIDPETQEEVNAPFIIKRVDDAYLAESRLRVQIANLESKLETLVEATDEFLAEEMPNIEAELGEGVPYTTVNAHGQLRDIARFTPEPRRYDKKSRLKEKSE